MKIVQNYYTTKILIKKSILNQNKKEFLKSEIHRNKYIGQIQKKLKAF